MPSGFNNMKVPSDFGGIKGKLMPGGDGPRKWRQGICSSLFEKCVNVPSNFKWYPSSSPTSSFSQISVKTGIQKELKTQNSTINESRQLTARMGEGRGSGVAYFYL